MLFLRHPQLFEQQAFNFMDAGFIESQAKAFTAEQQRSMIKWENKLTNQTDCAMTITGAAKVID